MLLFDNFRIMMLCDVSLKFLTDGSAEGRYPHLVRLDFAFSLLASDRIQNERERGSLLTKQAFAPLYK
jgi:hypothetical protein